MAAYPDHLDKPRHAELAGRAREVWVRRALLAVLLALVVVALLNGFGQRSTSATAVGNGASVEVRGPTRARGGLLFQNRITVHAQRDIDHPRIVLSQGWLDGLQINTIEPQPTSESSRDGKLVLSFDKLSAGDKIEVFFDFQVNPTHVGRTDQDVEVDNREQPLVRLPRSLTVFP
jgi:hypothetical protein